MILHLPYMIHKNYTVLNVDLNVKCEMKLKGDSRLILLMVGWEKISSEYTKGTYCKGKPEKLDDIHQER